MILWKHNIIYMALVALWPLPATARQPSATQEVKVVSDTLSYINSPKSFLDRLGAEALKLTGVFGPDGPFQERGPIGRDPLHPSYYVDKVTKFFDLRDDNRLLAARGNRHGPRGLSWGRLWLDAMDLALDSYSDAVARTYGAASPFGPLAMLSILGLPESKHQAESLFGEYDIMGPTAALGATGPLGRIGRDWDLITTKGGIRISRKNRKRATGIDVPFNLRGQRVSYSLYERYTQETAEALSRATRRNKRTIQVHGQQIDLGEHNALGTSFMVEDARLERSRKGRRAMSEMNLTVRSHKNQSEIVSFMVAPETYTNLGLQLRYLDKNGRERVKTSRLRGYVNYIKLQLPPDTTVKVKVFSLVDRGKVTGLPEGYTEKFRLYVSSSYPFLRDHKVEGYPQGRQTTKGDLSKFEKMMRRRQVDVRYVASLADGAEGSTDLGSDGRITVTLVKTRGRLPRYPTLIKELVQVNQLRSLARSTGGLRSLHDALAGNSRKARATRASMSSYALGKVSTFLQRHQEDRKHVLRARQRAASQVSRHGGFSTAPDRFWRMPIRPRRRRGGTR